MPTAKATTTRTRTPRASTAKAKATASTKAGSVDASAVIDLNKVSKPLYAYVGAADLAVEKVRTLPSAYVSSVKSAQAQVSQATDSVRTFPNTVLESISALPSKAKGTYADLVKRGHKLVGVVSKNPNTQIAAKQAKTARAQAKGAATSVRRSATTVSKQAKTARAQAKGAATSAGRSAASATKVAEATASEIG